VAQEYQIDTSSCPADFRMAVLRLIAAEDAARQHAHMYTTAKQEIGLETLIGCFAGEPFVVASGVKSAVNYNQKIADEQKQDLAKIQSALLDLAQVAMKYGVK
jgi:hypothetical protein